MALSTDQIINPSDIVSGFTASVVNSILSGAYHTGNPPMEGGRQCVPTYMMDHINNLPRTTSVGSTNTIVTASTIYYSLMSIVANLTRVGTFSWVRTFNTEGVISVVGSMGGKVVFAPGYAVSLATTSDGGVVTNNIISTSAINALFSNLYSAWSRSNRPTYNGRQDDCHVQCHTNCHQNCHGNCNSQCYGDSYGLDPANPRPRP